MSVLEWPPPPPDPRGAQVRALRHGSPLSLVQSLPIGGLSFLARPLPAAVRHPTSRPPAPSLLLPTNPLSSSPPTR